MVKAYNPFQRRASTRSVLIAVLILVVIIVGGATYLILAPNPGNGFFGAP
jgi:hypothetical protein